MNFFRALSLLVLLIRLAPAAGFDFAILGDRTGNAVPGVYEQVVKEVAARHPDFIINVGDTIEGLHDDSAVAEWQSLKPIWKSFRDTPFYLVPGNHDIWSPQSERVWRVETGRPPQYSFDFKGAHITVLDNSRSDVLSPEQLAFLQSDLAAHSAREPKFVIFHRPSWLFLVKFQNTEFTLHQLARKYGVSLVISGHVHQFDRSELEGIQYIMVGSSGGSLSHGKGPSPAATPNDGLYFGYAWVHVESGKAKLDFQRVEPPQ
ncbi:MAG TPA: metallophosphoesterase [Bryobacteraceae bacterium]|jgi:3',5'-cyclic AMP phosphodiesterase CpdA